MTKQEVKNNIDQDIRLKVSANSISPENVGKNMKDIIDLIPDAIPGPQGPPGPQGIQGNSGNNGQDGVEGLSAYGVAVQNGFTGTVEEWLQTLVGPQGENGTGLYLPTPQIAKRKVPIMIGKEGVEINVRNQFDTISPNNIIAEDLSNTLYPEEYYKERFDIYFNLFGTANDLQWLKLPDKRVELCMVSNRNYKVKTKGHNVNITTQGNKDLFTNAIVHPANIYLGTTESSSAGTIFSGSTANLNSFRSEWKLDETDFNNFGENLYGAGINRFNNPNITVELDIRDFIKVKYPNNGLPFKYPFRMIDSLGDPNIIDLKNIGRIKDYGKKKIYKRNLVLFFRVSAGVPGFFNETKKIYTKRVYSDLSQPIYISPKIKNFFNVLNDYDQGVIPFIYGHTTTIGRKK